MSVVSDCPSLEQIERFVAGQWHDAALAAHLVHCPKCAAVATEARANNRFLADLRPQPAATAGERAPALAVSGYAVEQTVHRGGQGIVYRARHLASKRTVALKIPLGAPQRGTRHERRFEREIELIARLRHPQIVTLYESGRTASGDLYFAMEYVDGQPVDEWVRTHLAAPAPGGAARVRRVLALVEQICGAVQHAHQHGVIHRDLKPSNILVDEFATPHVLDFGVAKLLEAERLQSSLTRTAEFVGTFAYAAPEQVQGDPDRVDTRTDVYALGVLLYELLTGHMPYSTSGPVGDVVDQIMAAAPRPPAHHNAAIDDELATIVLKALDKDPARRYSSAGHLALDLQRYRRHEPIDAKRDSAWYLLNKALRRYRAPVAAISASVVVLVLFATMMTIAWRRATTAELLAARESRQLAAELAAATINRGRLLAATGNIAAAEPLLWREFLQQPADTPLGRQALWALRELYAANPCRATYRLPAGTPARPWLPDPHVAVLQFVASDGALGEWDYPHPPSMIPALPPIGAWAEYAPLGRRVVIRGAPRDTLYDYGPAGLGPIRIPDASLTAPAVSSDGKWIAVGDAAGNMMLIDRGSGEVQHRWTAHAGRVAAACFGPNDSRLLTCGYDLRICAWNVADGSLAAERQLPGQPHRVQVGNLTLSPSGTLVALSVRLAIHLIDPETLSDERVLAGVRGAVQALAFGPSDRWLAAASYDKRIFLWDTGRATIVREFAGYTGAATGLCFTPAGELLAGTADDGAVRLWETGIGATARGDTPIAISAERSWQFAVFNPAGTAIFAADDSGGVMEYDAASSALRRASRAHTDVVFGISFSSGGREFATCGNDGLVCLWDVGSAAPRTIRSLPAAGAPPGAAGAPQTLAYAPDGRTLAVGDNTGAITLLDARTGALRGRFPLQTARIPQIRYVPGTNRIVAASMDGTLAVWDTEAHRTIMCWPAHAGGVRTVDVSWDGRWIASGGDDALVRVWDATTGALRAVGAAHQQDVFFVRFSPDGQLLASCERGQIRDGASLIILWDPATGRDLARLRGHGDMVFSLDFAPGGSRLLSCSRDRQILVHDLTYYDGHIAGNRDAMIAAVHAATPPPRASDH